MTAAAHIAADLPESLAEVVEAIGLPATLKLAERWGGIRLYVPLPENIDADHPIAKVIGLDLARKFATVWLHNPDRRPSFPRCVDAIRRARNRALRADYRVLTAPQVALKYQLTERQVYAIAAAGDDERPAPQLGLF